MIPKLQRRLSRLHMEAILGANQAAVCNFPQRQKRLPIVKAAIWRDVVRRSHGAAARLVGLGHCHKFELFWMAQGVGALGVHAPGACTDQNS